MQSNNKSWFNLVFIKYLQNKIQVTFKIRLISIDALAKDVLKCYI
ncbi:hypothetical protein SRABI36_02814 [Pedobacter sp. Bi36]|jgi:hypothetical protein|nr:hypothetical protein [Flavobacterium sp. W4I14]CAH0234844.1 hypothetical protein SRABI36_02814 [Pedobacter sp. Bi36]CAH0261492.1 hypothetical protein SRABI126_03214 [Pedobacter sp. Bi126]